jgi:hypothetical protein
MTIEGVVIPLTEMTDDHLINLIRRMYKLAESGVTKECMRTEEYEKEAKRRGLQYIREEN